MNKITDYVSPMDDVERAFMVRQALAAAAIARAQKEEGRFVPSDNKLEEVLARVTPRAIEAVTIHASSATELGKAIRAAVSAGDLLPPRVHYTDEELEL